MKKLLVALVCLMLLAGLCAAWAESGADVLGKPLDDFTVKTIDGGTFTLSEALKSHDVVVINLRATWCPPCEMEFPYLEAAYEAYSDRVALIALSIEPEDTPEALTEYAESHGMTFPVGSDVETGLMNKFAASAIPTTAVVDRFGNVALIEMGAKSSTNSFTALFDYFLDPGYTETTVLDEFPAPRPVAGADEAQLSAAANAEGSAIAFRNPTDGETWPMLVDAIGVAASNAGVDDSAAAVYADVTASAGDSLAFDFRTSTQPACDALFVNIDGETVKRFTGEHDWTSWALPLPAGTHEIAFGYQKDAYDDAGEDCAWVANVRVATGSEAQALLDAMPAQPVGEAFSAAPGEGATPVVFDDPNGLVDYYFGTVTGWIVDADSAVIDMTLSPAEDPETVLVYDMIGSYALAVKDDGSGYQIAPSLAKDDYDVVDILPSANAEARTLLLFDGEAGAEAFTEYLAMYGIDVSWKYAE